MQSAPKTKCEDVLGQRIHQATRAMIAPRVTVIHERSVGPCSSVARRDALALKVPSGWSKPTSTRAKIESANKNGSPPSGLQLLASPATSLPLGISLPNYMWFAFASFGAVVKLELHRATFVAQLCQGLCSSSRAIPQAFLSASNLRHESAWSGTCQISHP